MSASNGSSSGGLRRFLFENSAFLIGGAVAALVWANIDAEAYHHFIHTIVFGEGAGQLPAEDASHPLNLHFLVNDVFMAFFFAIAGKEVWEALLPGGPLSSFRKAATPLLATLGGMAGPAALYLALVYTIGPETLSRGWAVPMATDIAFSYMLARLIFGPGHPAIPFLLLLAIADDAGGLIILAVFYPQESPEPMWLLLTAAAVLIGFGMRRLRLKSFWWYLLIPGTLSWFSFFEAHLHPALGLVPIIPTMPHAHTDLGLFVRKELGRRDTLNAFEHWWKNPVELILGVFGFVNAGVVFSSVGPGTWFVLAGLLLGKPIGIALFTWVGKVVGGLEVPEGMTFRHVISIGMIAGLGFTVALFVADAAYRGRPELDEVKMGALASFAAAITAYVGSRALGIRAVKGDDDDSNGDDAEDDSDSTSDT